MVPTPAPRPALDQSRLTGLASGWWVEVVDSAGSTNAVVAERARAGEREGLVLATEHQTAGRGRLDRTWETPARVALTFSVLLRPTLPPPAWPMLPLLTGYAVHAALVDRVPEVSLKWPNDVLVGEHKIAGILVERVETPQGPAAVVGVGINVNQTREELPETGTSLHLELGEQFDRTDLLRQVLGSLHALQPLTEEPDQLRTAYAQVCDTVGRPVEVHLPGGERVRGEALDLDVTGALVVATDDPGRDGMLTVSAGDVVHVRPTR